MAKVKGAVRFSDGQMMFFLYNMFCDACKPRLFDTLAELDDDATWNDPQTEVYDKTHQPGGEQVEVIPLFGFDNMEVAFHSRVDRINKIIIGPLDDESAYREGLFSRNFQ